MDINLGDITDSRKISGTIRAVQKFTFQTIPNGSEYSYQNVWYSYDVTDCTSNFRIAGIANADAIGGIKLLDVSFEQEFVDLEEIEFGYDYNGGFPLPKYYSYSPVIYVRRQQLNAVVKCYDVGGTLLHSLAVGDPTSGDYSFKITDVAHTDWAIAELGAASNTGWDIYLPYELEVESTFERHIIYNENIYGGKDIFHAYGPYNEPCGLPPGEFEVYYVPKSYRLKFTAGNQTREYTANYTEAQKLAYRYGLKDCNVHLAHGGYTNGVGWDGTTLTLANASMSWNGVNSLQTAADVAYNTNNKATISNGVISFITNASLQPNTLSVDYSATCPKYSARYNVSVEDLDYTDLLATVSLQSGAITGAANGNALTKEYAGRWRVRLNTPNSPYPTASSDDTGGNAGEFFAIHNAGSITNIDAINQPTFGMDVAPPDFPQWLKYNDSRLDMVCGDLLKWDSAVTLSVPESMQAIRFADFTWSLSSGLTASVVDGALQIVVPQNATNPQISRAASSGSLAGGRFLRLDYTGSSAKLSIAGRSWDVTSTGNIVDVLTAKGQTASNNSQTAWDATDPGGVFGIRSATDVVISNLQPGTYTFRSIDIVRNPIAEHREMAAYIYSPFVGEIPGDSRQNDPPVLVKTPLLGDSEYTNRCRSRIGVVLVDGVVAAELYGVEHYAVAAQLPDVNWQHAAISLESSAFCYPQNGFVSVAVNKSKAWHADREAAWLVEGKYTGSSSILLNWQPSISRIKLPFGEVGSMQYALKKWCDGKARALALKTDGTPADKVTLLKYKQPDVAAYESVDLTPDAAGYVVTPALPQATCRWFTVTAVSGNTITVSGLTGSYVGYDVYLPRYIDNEVQPPLLARITAHNQATGELTLNITPTGVNNGVHGVVYIPYSYKLQCGSQSVEIPMRSRNISFAQFLIELIVQHGPIYDPNNTGQRPIYSTISGKLMFI